MTDVDVKSLLGRKIEDVEAPKPVPAGHYKATIRGHEFGKSTKNQTPYVRFIVTLSDPDDDVDDSALDAFGGLEKLMNRKMYVTFFLTEDAIFRLRDFFEKDLKLDISGRNFDDVIPEVNGLDFKVLIEQTLSDKGQIFSNIASTHPNED